MLILQVCLSAVVVSCVTLCGFCKLTLPSFISSGMVLQREPVHAVVWGKSSCEKGSKVTVKLNSKVIVNSKVMGNESLTFEKSSGEWSAELNPQKAGTGNSIEIEDCDSHVLLKDIAFGEVLLVSGQSNAVFSVHDDSTINRTLKECTKYKNLRMYTGKLQQGDNLLDNLPPKYQTGTWLRSEPSGFGDKWMSYPSALGYFVAAGLSDFLGLDIPVGFVTSAWGGRPVEMFCSKEALAQCSQVQGEEGEEEEKQEEKEFRPSPSSPSSPSSSSSSSSSSSLQEELILDDDFFRLTGEAKPTPPGKNGNGVLFNGLINPLLKMKFKAALWYQGEANSRLEDKSYYGCQFTAMISDWRAKMKQRLPFVFIELAGFENDDFTNVRQQQKEALKLPDVGFASAFDLGSRHNVHPTAKRELGRRALLPVLRIAFGENVQVESTTGPVFKQAKLLDNGKTLRIEYQSGSGKDMSFDPSLDCDSCCSGDSGFEVSVNGVWKSVSMDSVNINSLDRTVEIQIDGEVDKNKPTLVRYGQVKFLQCVLHANFDKMSGTLPAVPFAAQKVH